MNANHTSEFVAATKENWKILVAQELKNHTLDHFPWEIADGVFLDHYYTADELEATAIQKIQNSQRHSAQWQRALRVKYEHDDQVIEFIKNNSGAKDISIWIQLPSLIPTHAALQRILTEANLKDIAVYFMVADAIEEAFQTFASLHLGKGGIVLDPITKWMSADLSIPFDNAIYNQSIFRQSPAQPFKTLCIDGDFYHNRGADPAQELGFILGNLVHTLDQLTDLGIAPKDAFLQIFFSVSVGTQYLTEIAKLRALRFLIHQIAAAYAVSPADYIPFIHVNTSTLYHTTRASHINLIRSTSEALSAAIGGCDSLYIHPYTSDNSFAERIGNNISLLLTHEAHLNTVFDPARGSYLIENATQILIKAGWDKFLQIEKMGGIVEAWESGFLKKELDQSFARKLTNLEMDGVLLGVNKYKEKQINQDMNPKGLYPNLEMAYLAKQSNQIL